MNLLRYYEAKAQNRSTVQYLRQLSNDGRIEYLPSALGLHFRKFDINSPDYDERYVSDNIADKPFVQLLTCSDELQAIVAKNGDCKVVGANHCGNKALCAVCGTREARRVSSQLNYLFFRNRNKGLKYFMLTLTLPNNFNGFREEFEIYSKCLVELAEFFGYNTTFLDKSPCKGYFGAKELTYHHSKGWHPHIHIIVAYDSLKLTRRGQVKSLGFVGGRFISTLSVRNRFQDLIKRKFPDYYNSHREAFDIGLNIDFQPVSSSSDLCEEICKYFIDYNSFRDADTLFVYLRDIYKVRKYVKVGCFGWNKDLEFLWKEWCADGKPTEQNAHFIQFVQQKTGSIYFGYRIGRYNGSNYRLPCFYKPSECFNDGKPIDLKYNRKYSGKYDLSGQYTGFIWNGNTLREVCISDYECFGHINLPRNDMSDLLTVLVSHKINLTTLRPIP